MHGLALFILLSATLILKNVFNLLHDCAVVGRVELIVLNDGLAKVSTELHQHTGVEVQVRVLTEVRPAEARLDRVRVLDCELLPAYDTARALLRSLNAECTVHIAENFSLLFQHVGKDALAMPRIALLRVSIHKNVLLARVPVQIKEARYVPLLLEAPYQPLQRLQYWLHVLRWLDPAPVQVITVEVAACVPVDDAIDVDHRDDLEDVVVTEELGADRRAQQVVEDAKHHVRGSSLARVHPTADDDAFFSFLLLRFVDIRTDRQKVDWITSQSLTKHTPCEFVRTARVRLAPAYVSLHIRVSVRIAMRQVDRVVVVLEGCRKCQRKVVEGAFSLETIRIVADVLSAAPPALVVTLCVDLRVNKRLHAVVVEAVRLDKVDDVEAVEAIGSSIRHSEVEPLRLAARIIIVLQN